MSMFFSQQPANGSMNGSMNGSNGSAPTADTAAANGFPGYAGGLSNALLNYGLNLSRENTVSPAQTVPGAFGSKTAKPTPIDAWGKGDNLPPSDVGDYLARWDPATRFYLLITEMVSGLEFNVEGPKFTLSCRDAAGESKVVLEMTRPPRPLFDAQMTKVFSRASERNDRTAEILTQVQPQFAYWSAICNLHPSRTSWTIELTTAVLHFSMLICQRIKHALACPRPIEYSALVQPIILTPAYGTFPMGHATEAYMFAGIMKVILGKAGNALDQSGTAEQLALIARRISDNRVIAGVHFPIDAPGGFVLADALCAYLRARLDGSTATGRGFDGAALPSDWDADPMLACSRPKEPGAIAWNTDPYTPPKSKILRYMLQRAEAEFLYPAETGAIK